MAKNDFTFTTSDRVIFKGYASPPEDGAIFEEGEVIIITKTVEAGEDENGPFEQYEAKAEADDTRQDTVFFPDDAEVLADAAPEAEAGTETKAKPKRTRAKPAAKKAAAKPAAKKAAAKPAAKKAAAKPAAKKATATKAKPAAKKAATKPAAKKATTTKTKAKPAAKAKTKAKAAPAPAAETNTDDEAQALVLTAEVTSLVEGESAVESARDLLRTVDTTYFNLGGVLSYIQEEGAYKDAGYDDFFEFCDTELGQQKSKVYQLMRIYRKFSALGLDAERFTGIGWTYARAMAPVVSAENVDELVDKAGNMSRDDFENEIRTSYVSGNEGGETKARKTRFKFALHEDQAANAEKVIDDIKRELDTEDLSAVFAHLVTSYMQHTEIETTQEEDIAYVEQKYGIELVEAEAE